LFIRRLEKFLSLEPADQRILGYAFCLVAFARVALWIFPFATVHRRLITSTRTRMTSNPQNVEDVMGAIERASKFVPDATCLTQSVAAQVLLARMGIRSTLRFGARRGVSGAFEAHAWVECDGKVVSQEPAGEFFSPLPPVV